MDASHIISITPNDIEKGSEKCFEGYPLSSQNGFIQGKNKKGVIEVLEIQKQLFQRYIPQPPAFSNTVKEYSQSDDEHFPCCRYNNRFVIFGSLEESRVLEQRLHVFRNDVCSLKDLVKSIKLNQQRIAELTASGDITSCFQLHEEINVKTKTAANMVKRIANNKECNTIISNTLEFKMKAAAEISEYEQAQNIKSTLEIYSNLVSILQDKNTRITTQMTISMEEALETAMQLSNYLTD